MTSPSLLARTTVVTGEDLVSGELMPSFTTKREEFRKKNEEADNILAHQMVVVASGENRGLYVFI